MPTFELDVVQVVVVRRRVVVEDVLTIEEAEAVIRGDGDYEVRKSHEICVEKTLLVERAEGTFTD